MRNWIRIACSRALAVALVTGVLAAAILSGTVEAQTPSATRSFAATWVAPGAELRVTVAAANYGPFGQVVETLPEGFAFLRTDLEDDAVEIEGQTVRFTIFGVTAFYYVLRAPTTAGTYTFAGVVVNSDREERTVSGQSRLRVGPPPTPTATATPAPAATPTQVPTATPTPAPTAPPTATPTATPLPVTTATPTLVSVPAATATATATPTATPPSAATPAPTATPEPTATPVPEPTAMPTPAATSTAAEQGGSRSGLPPLLWLIVILVGLGTLLAVASYIRTRR